MCQRPCMQRTLTSLLITALRRAQMCSIAVKAMKARKRGAIINIGSASASYLPSYPLYAVYAATKARGPVRVVQYLISPGFGRPGGKAVRRNCMAQAHVSQCAMVWICGPNQQCGLGAVVRG